MQWYFVSPLDILLFREAKPFSPGDGSWAKGLFPPLPITVFQALRSLLAETAKSEESKPRTLEFLGPFLVGPDNQIWLPTPKDLMVLYAERGDRKRTQSTWVALIRLQTLDADFAYSSNIPALAFPIVNPIGDVPPQCLHPDYMGQPQPWIKAEALKRYLADDRDAFIQSIGSTCPCNPEDFTSNPWDVQILPHTHMQSDCKQVRDADGYFTEVATRLKPGWRFLVGMTGDTLPPMGVIRLGGEGHRAMVEAIADNSLIDPINQLLNHSIPSDSSKTTTAYLLTPGLASSDQNRHSAIPKGWEDNLCGCATDRPILWGGISQVRRRTVERPERGDPEFSLLPQRAFIPPGTVYRFSRPPTQQQLMPESTNATQATFHSLNYGKLLWGQQ
jgi:CRISPR-associated protein Cmr3